MVQFLMSDGLPLFCEGLRLPLAGAGSQRLFVRNAQRKVPE